MTSTIPSSLWYNCHKFIKVMNYEFLQMCYVDRFSANQLPYNSKFLPFYRFEACVIPSLQWQTSPFCAITLESLSRPKTNTPHGPSPIINTSTTSLLTCMIATYWAMRIGSSRRTNSAGLWDYKLCVIGQTLLPLLITSTIPWRLPAVLFMLNQNLSLNKPIPLMPIAIQSKVPWRIPRTCLVLITSAVGRSATK